MDYGSTSAEWQRKDSIAGHWTFVAVCLFCSLVIETEALFFWGRIRLSPQFHTKIHKIWEFAGFDFLDYQGLSVQRFPKPIVVQYNRGL
jgi:hypothetical protein